MNSKKEWTTPEITFVRNQHKKGNSRFTIVKKFYERFLYRRTPDSIKHCIDTNCADIEKYIPKVLLIDVETKPRLYYAWGPKTEYLGLEMMVEDGAMMSWSAKWLGNDKIYYLDQRGNEKNLINDKKLMKPLHKLMEEADIVIWQNGDAFDYGIINDRFTEHGMELPSKYRTIDTKKIAKRHLRLPYNSLAYMTDRFNKKYKKLDHSEFAGIKLWKECMKGNTKAWNSMKKYNEYDVLSLEELFVDTLAKLAKDNKTVQDAMRAYNAAKK
jgi:uncharacterized protein YprB with RNaseH-like and TPR domain